MTRWPVLAYAAVALAASAAWAADPPAVTVLRGSAALPEPAAPPPQPQPQPAVVERQTVIYLPAYSMSYWPPVVVSQAPLRHRPAPAAAPAVPDGWPLIGRERR